MQGCAVSCAQVGRFWGHKLPTELAVFAVVPVIGGLASQEYCTRRSLLRLSDAELFSRDDPHHVLKVLCLCTLMVL